MMTSYSTVNLPVAPGEPDDPVDPDEPTGPVGPAGPLAPVAPVGPDRPVEPESPVEPVAPIKPVAPLRPGTPLEQNQSQNHAIPDSRLTGERKTLLGDDRKILKSGSDKFRCSVGASYR